jgi:hypothetical protein
MNILMLRVVRKKSDGKIYVYNLSTKKFHGPYKNVGNAKTAKTRLIKEDAMESLGLTKCYGAVSGKVYWE